MASIVTITAAAGNTVAIEVKIQNPGVDQLSTVADLNANAVMTATVSCNTARLYVDEKSSNI